MAIQIFLGFLLLLGGAELMVRGAVNIAKSLGLSTIVIGMTVVAFGTSFPELVVSVDAALNNAGGIALGNVIGSNIANILLILGASIVFVPPTIKRGELTFDAGGMLLSSVVFTYLCWRGFLGLGAGIVLLVVFSFFYALSYLREVKKKPPIPTKILHEEVEEYQKLPGRYWVSWLAFTGGLAGVLFGGDILVKGGVSLARVLGVTEEVIGVTLIAFGTSLPELAAAVIAAYRGHAGLALGTVIGSNIFNITGIIGLATVMTPIPVPLQIRLFDVWVMFGITALLYVFLAGIWKMTRYVGVLFLSIYCLYIALQAYGVDRLLTLFMRVE